MKSEEQFARAMVEKLQTVLLESAGLRTVVISGQTVSFESAQSQYEYWKRRLDQVTGQRPLIVPLTLEGGT